MSQEEPRAFDPTQRVGLYSLGVNVALAGTKFVLAALSGSLALRADAIHSLVDVVASLVVIAGLLIAKRRSRAFPYGLYKVENLVAVVLSVLIFFAGYEIALEAITGPAVRLGYVVPTASGVVVVIATAFLFSWYEGRVGRETGSPSLKADSRHFRSDVLASGVVLIAILGNALGLPLDRAGAGVIVIFIVWAGWGLLSDGMRVLLDASLDLESLDAIRKIISSNKGIAEIKSLRGRNSGRFKFVEAEVTMRTRELSKAHQISSELEQSIRETIPHVDRVLIHYEPEAKEEVKWAIPLQDLDGALAPDFGKARYFAFITIRSRTGEVTGKEVLANPYADLERQRGIRAAKFLVDQGIDGTVLRDNLEGKGPYYVLDDAAVEMRITEKNKLEDALHELVERAPGEVSGTANGVAPDTQSPSWRPSGGKSDLDKTTDRS